MLLEVSQAESKHRLEISCHRDNRDQSVFSLSSQGKVNILANVGISSYLDAHRHWLILDGDSVLQCANRLPQEKPRYCM